MTLSITDQNTGNPYIDGLLAGEHWLDPASLTYGFSSPYPQVYGVGEPNTLRLLTIQQQIAVTAILSEYATSIALNFTQTTGYADLAYAGSSAPSTSWAYTPANYQEAGDVWLGSRFNANPIKGGYDWLTLIHETGHALGLSHPAPGDHDNLNYTVMSYRSYAGGTNLAYLNARWDYPTTPMLDDVQALQSLYGPAPSNTNVYSWSPTTGEESINGAPQGAPGANRVYMTVDTDGTYDFSNYTTPLTIDMRPGHWTTLDPEQRAAFALGNIANAYDSQISNVIGGRGNDLIYSNDSGNYIDGGRGNDTVVYQGLASAHTVQSIPNAWIVDSDVLRNIEFLQFDDRTITLLHAPAPSICLVGFNPSGDYA